MGMVEVMSFSTQLVQRSQKNSQQTKHKLNTAFHDRFYSKWKWTYKIEVEVFLELKRFDNKIHQN